MAKITIGFGIFLVALGLAGYFGTGMASWTALIPAFVGLPLAGFGALALIQPLRMHAMHLAVLVGLLGFLGGAFSLVRPIIKGSDIKPIAATMQALLALSCAVFVGFCVKSFIDARRARMQKTE